MKTINESNRDAKLRADGWERRTITEEPRLTELVELYKELNLEVHLEPATSHLLREINEECQVCFTHTVNNFMIIYTRNKNEDQK